MADHEQLIERTLMGQGVILIGYMISALVVISNNYAGFDGFFTGIIFGASIYLTHWGLKNISRTLYGIILGAVAVLVFVSLESAIFWGQYSDCAHYSTRDDSSPPTMRPTQSPVEDTRRALDAMGLEAPAAAWSVAGVAEYVLSSFSEYFAEEQHDAYSRALSGSISSECRSQSAMKSVCAFSVFMFLSYLVLGGFLVHFKNAILGSAPLNEGYDTVGGVSTSGKTGGAGPQATKFPTSADF